jgi:hypothetical protein
MGKSKKMIIFCFCLFFLFLMAGAGYVFAEEDVFPGNNPNAPRDIKGIITGSDTGTGILGKTLFAGARTDPREVARDIIFVVFSLLGTLMVALIVYSGFLWMMAVKTGGEKDKILAARAHLTNAIIGAVIVLSAWTISMFVLDALKQTVSEGTVSDDGSAATNAGDGRIKMSLDTICTAACVNLADWGGCKNSCKNACRDSKYTGSCKCHITNKGILGIGVTGGCEGKVD